MHTYWNDKPSDKLRKIKIIRRPFIIWKCWTLCDSPNPLNKNSKRAQTPMLRTADLNRDPECGSCGTLEIVNVKITHSLKWTNTYTPRWNKKLLTPLQYIHSNTVWSNVMFDIPCLIVCLLWFFPQLVHASKDQVHCDFAIQGLYKPQSMNSLIWIIFSKANVVSNKKFQLSSFLYGTLIQSSNWIGIYRNYYVNFEWLS